MTVFLFILLPLFIENPNIPPETNQTHTQKKMLKKIKEIIQPTTNPGGLSFSLSLSKSKRKIAAQIPPTSDKEEYDKKRAQAKNEKLHRLYTHELDVELALKHLSIEEEHREHVTCPSSGTSTTSATSITTNSTTDTTVTSSAASDMGTFSTAPTNDTSASNSDKVRPPDPDAGAGACLDHIPRLHSNNVNSNNSMYNAFPLLLLLLLLPTHTTS